MDNPFQSPAILSICPGILGLERGLERAIGPVRTVAYVETEAFIVENLVCQMESGILGAAPVFSDIKTFPWVHFRNKIHGIVGGYPCQPFSHVGKQLGEKDPRHLWPYICDGIVASAPVWCWFENVSNHLTIGYDQVRRDLQRIGYSVEEGIYSAEEIGAPHVRKRLFILAVDNSILSGLQGYARDDSGENRWQKPVRSATETGFPLGQGIDQYEWEEPRLKPSVGFTINGYSYQEDLLRAAGNSVVEQTAELAFIELMEKHIKNHGRK